MVKYLILAFLLFPLLLKSQEKLTFHQVDSLTYQYFLKGQWKELINLTKKSEPLGFESKYLYQRAGYAYFMTADYFLARDQYEKALKFDPVDPVTLEYLYYCGLNTGSEESARYYARNLDPETLKRLGIVSIKPVDALDMELNYKSNDATTRSYVS
jgi:tetratricopeptide (TPR) repeat protein